MKELDPLVLYSVLHEMMGPLLWVLLLLAAFGIVGFLVAVVRERGTNSRRLIRSELVGIVGGFAALWIMAKVTLSGFSDAGGPVDWLLVGLIWGIGVVGTTMLAYVILTLSASLTSRRAGNVKLGAAEA